VSEPTGPADVSEQLELIHARLEASNPELYRHFALYLQVLREILSGRVQQACFHLSTQVHPHRYTLLPLEERRHLHRRTTLLVDRCRSLLTVEQLAALAAQIDRERRSRPPRQRPRLTEAGLLAAHEQSLGESEPSFPDLPSGSVRLELTPPLSMDLFAWVQPDAEEKEAEEEAEEQDRDEDEDEDDRDSGAGEKGGWSGVEALFTDEPDALRPSPWLQGELPKDPVMLLLWLDGMEVALTRRLRNLSHAINVELLRAGLSHGLLPVNLLDAVLDGQLEPEAAPANLLRLQLPFRASGGEAPLQAMAVLLRSTDLELEEPRLRTCRRRLQQHRQEVRRMARQFRLLQRRLQAQEAERLWLQDIGAMDRKDD
jgi:hypothetical protein